MAGYLAIWALTSLAFAWLLGYAYQDHTQRPPDADDRAVSILAGAVWPVTWASAALVCVFVPAGKFLAWVFQNPLNAAYRAGNRKK